MCLQGTSKARRSPARARADEQAPRPAPRETSLPDPRTRAAPTVPRGRPTPLPSAPQAGATRSFRDPVPVRDDAYVREDVGTQAGRREREFRVCLAPLPSSVKPGVSRLFLVPWWRRRVGGCGVADSASRGPGRGRGQRRAPPRSRAPSPVPEEGGRALGCLRQGPLRPQPGVRFRPTAPGGWAWLCGSLKMPFESNACKVTLHQPQLAVSGASGRLTFCL